MKKSRSWFAGCLTLSLAVTSYGQITWHDQLTKVVQQSLPTASVGVMIMDAETGKPLYENNANKFFTPASTLKIFTAAAALRYLGSGYRYHTTVSIVPNQLKNGVLQGNLYIKFSGDPSLRVDDLQTVLLQAHKFGINTITGHVVVDDTRFQPPNSAPGWTSDSMFWSYAAPITTVILNENQFTFKFVPSKTLGNPVKIQPGNNMQYMQLESQLRTVTYAQSMHDCSLVLDVDQQNKVHLSGCWPLGVASWQTLSIANPSLFALRVIQQTLKQAHVTVRGHFFTAHEPKNLQVIADHTSNNLAQLLKHTLKKSDNVYAESITKTLGSARVGQGTFLQGVNTIKQSLGGMTGIDFHRTALFDGSGQSRYDLVTPYQMTQLLYAVYHDPVLKKDFMEALSISGRDGTLSYRLSTREMVGKVLAKTGSLKGVASLAGYITTRSGHRLIFAIMVNDIITKLRPARALEDQICTILYRTY